MIIFTVNPDPDPATGAFSPERQRANKASEVSEGYPANQEGRTFRRSFPAPDQNDIRRERQWNVEKYSYSTEVLLVLSTVEECPSVIRASSCSMAAGVRQVRSMRSTRGPHVSFQLPVCHDS
jgi:hypothetical protein